MPQRPHAPMPQEPASLLPREYLPVGMSVRQYVTIFGAYRLWIAAVTALAVLMGAVASAVLPKTYEATAALLIDYKINDPLTGQELPAQLAASYIATQLDLLTSPQLMLEVVDRLGWEQDPAFAAAATDATTLREVLAERVRKHLEAKTFRDSRLLRITYADHDPEVAARVANTVTQVYLESRGSSNPNSNVVQALKAQLVALETRLAGLSETLGPRHPDRVQAAAEIESVRARLKAEMGDSGLPAAEAERGARVPRPPYYSVQLGWAASQASARAILQPFANDPDARIEHRGNDWLIRAGNWSQRSDAERALAGFKARGVADARVLQMQTPVPWLLPSGETVKPGEPRPTAGPAVLEPGVRGKYSNATLISVATPPLKPSRPRLSVNLVAGFVAGLLLGVASALLRELLDRRVRCREDLERDLGVAVLAEFDGRARR